MLETNSSFQIIPYALLTGWVIYAIYVLLRARNHPTTANPYQLASIPSVFTTIGVLGTFVGIFIALRSFDVDDIDGSITTLLTGLKTAFLSSIIGIVLSLLSARIVESLQKRLSKDTRVPLSSEASLLSELLAEMKNGNQHSLQHSERADDHRQRLETRLQTIEAQLKTQADHNRHDITQLLELTRLEANKRAEQLSEVSAWMESLHSEVVRSREHTQEQLHALSSKFDDFGEQLAKNNTEVLADAIERVIGNFNDKLNELLERLVRKNFEELNQSVQQLNIWQAENKKMVNRLVVQFHEVADNFERSSGSITNITEQTHLLVKEDGRLVKLIGGLEEVVSEENHFKSSIEKLRTITEAYDIAWGKSVAWMEKQQNFTLAVDQLVDKLQEIEQLRQQTGGFFDDVRDRLNESSGVLKNGSKQLQQQVDELDNSFHSRLNESFQNLDNILSEMVEGYSERLTQVQ